MSGALKGFFTTTIFLGANMAAAGAISAGVKVYDERRMRTQYGALSVEEMQQRKAALEAKANGPHYWVCGGRSGVPTPAGRAAHDARVLGGMIAERNASSAPSHG